MLRLCRSLRMSQLQILVRVRFPTSFPFIFSGMKVAVTLAIIGIVVGEFIASQIPGASFRVFEASSHVPFYEEPEAFNEALDAFVAGLP